MEDAFYEIVRIEGRVVRGKREGSWEQDRERQISKGELKEAVKRMKDGKAEGIDGIPSEAWKYGGEELEEWA